ncbi:hypothetical protein ACC811_36885, partial [Rhizobium ruizarguesonis]
LNHVPVVGTAMEELTSGRLGRPSPIGRKKARWEGIVSATSASCIGSLLGLVWIVWQVRFMPLLNIMQHAIFHCLGFLIA